MLHSNCELASFAHNEEIHVVSSVMSVQVGTYENIYIMGIRIDNSCSFPLSEILHNQKPV
jgi:hypothetical protein